MKLTFVLPAIGKKKSDKYLRSWLMEPLTIAVLSSMIPKEWEKEFFDDRIEKINYETDCNMVFITVETYTAKRAYFIANEYRKRGKTVVMGGYHATLLPDEVKEHCDSVMCGNAEHIIDEVLNDFKNGCLKEKYFGEACIGYKLPDRTIYADKEKKYLPV
ncbi:MAG: radical SAM protein, partial [Clostridia bacterium]|nr:radical SAM protein [Clostridia bacterium]